MQISFAWCADMDWFKSKKVSQKCPRTGQRVWTAAVRDMLWEGLRSTMRMLTFVPPRSARKAPFGLEQVKWFTTFTPHTLHRGTNMHPIRCLICGASDSIHHRYWECPHSSALRAKVDPVSMDLVPSLPRSVFCPSLLCFPPLLFDKCHSSLVLLCTNKDNLPCWHKFKSITFYGHGNVLWFCCIPGLPMPFHGLQGEMVVSLECNCDQSKLCRQTATCGRVDQLPVFLN